MINWFRCNFQERDDGIYFCDGLHPKHDDCQWSKLTLAHIEEMNEDAKRLLTIIKNAPKPFGKTDSELAKEYRSWYLGSRLNMKATEQRFVPEPREAQ